MSEHNEGVRSVRTCPKCQSTYCNLITHAMKDDVWWYVECGSCKYRGKRVPAPHNKSSDLCDAMGWDGMKKEHAE